MGLHKDEGIPALALAEECAEVIQVINKAYRFYSDDIWNEVPPGKNKSRWEQLEEEMSDLFYQWNRLRTERGLK